MSQTSIILFDDARAREWHPFTLTRPAGELLFGTLLMRERAERIFGAPVVRHLSSAENLIGFTEEGAPAVAGFEAVPSNGDRIFLLSRAVPAWSVRHSWRPCDREGTIRVGGRVAGWFAPAGSPAPDPGFFDNPSSLEGGRSAANLDGRVIEEIWHLISRTAEQIRFDILALHPGHQAPQLPPGVHHWGEHPLVVHPTARLEPGCVIDTRNGPVWIDEKAEVRAFTRLAGPAYIGCGSHLLGGSVECVSIGPVCRIRGEISSTVCLGYTNKQHDGHLGHAYLGRWVNLGAETTNSDLKNNYGSIRIWTPGGERDSGEVKLGCLLGDHVKTGIGLLLNTGSVIGAGSNLYGADMPPRFVPPFSWGTGAELVEYRVDKFLEVAERAMTRRDICITDATREQLRRAFREGRRQARTGSGRDG
jgi:UDP-N-acetylglucosamine diphosphorylase / glucose-1-phosphate thymidylyltransferase / UDP-N-acetylgalactosamine diphosphorylase / glucosamine-1-phosphate N-acetyltransferase / galactosamine-1-phosphate N-acetyltransferase